MTTEVGATGGQSSLRNIGHEKRVVLSHPVRAVGPKDSTRIAKGGLRPLTGVEMEGEGETVVAQKLWDAVCVEEKVVWLPHGPEVGLCDRLGTGYKRR